MPSSTYSRISAYIPSTWESALHYMKHTFMMPSTVQVFTDMTGMTDRKVTKYVETGIENNIGETQDLSSFYYDRELLATLSPKEIGKQFVITDRRVETDLEPVMAQAAVDLGYSLGRQVETDLLGTFSSFTGGSIGTTTTAFSMTSLIEARTILEANKIPGGYTAVIHPYQYLDIYKDWVSSSNTPPEDIRNQAQQNYFVGNISGVRVMVSSLVPRIKTSAVYSLDASAATAGTFVLQVGDYERTTDIAYNASAAAVDAALEALDGVGAGGVTVTLSAGVYTITFTGNLAGTPVNLSLNDENITGTITLTQSSVGSTYARGGLYTRDAIAFDLRRGFRLEADRDPSLRHTELNATMIYAAGVWEASHGVSLLSDVTAPDGS